MVFAVAVVSIFVALVFALAGCATAATGPRVYFSIAEHADGSRPRVYVAAESISRDDQPIAMTVLDPASGRALDTFPLSTSGARPCGVTSGDSAGDAVGYVALDNRYVPVGRWQDAATGRAEPYRVRLYFRSDQGVIWEAEVMPSYSGCPTK